MRKQPLPVLLVSLFAVGCGSSSVGEVSGRVTLDTKPLANARITFQPIGGSTTYPGMGSYGNTNANGEYTLSLVDGKGRGAVIGKHRVQIAIVPSEEDAKDDHPRRGFVDPIPDRYKLNSILRYDVRPGVNENVNFDLTTK
jgi:hypothetical protein